MVTDTLSRRYALLSIMESKVLGFYYVLKLYKGDLDFKGILKEIPENIPYTI